MNYSEMTDFEINCAVAGALNMPPWPRYGYAGTQLEPYTAAICHGGGRLGGFDPCNSWNDAGPIIEKESISLTCHQSRKEWAAIFNRHAMAAHRNPLRAAMECYLIKTERENAA